MTRDAFEAMRAPHGALFVGSAAEVTPVGSIGPWTFEVGDLTRQLMADYAALVRGAVSNS